jgi:hypothetical protein
MYCRSWELGIETHDATLPIAKSYLLRTYYVRLVVQQLPILVICLLCILPQHRWSLSSQTMIIHRPGKNKGGFPPPTPSTCRPQPSLQDIEVTKLDDFLCSCSKYGLYFRTCLFCGGRCIFHMLPSSVCNELRGDRIHSSYNTA